MVVDNILLTILIAIVIARFIYLLQDDFKNR